MNFWGEGRTGAEMMEQGLTDDDATNGTSILDVSGFLGKHTLAPLDQGDLAGHCLGVSEL